MSECPYCGQDVFCSDCGEKMDGGDIDGLLVLCSKCKTEVEYINHFNVGCFEVIK